MKGYRFLEIQAAFDWLNMQAELHHALGNEQTATEIRESILQDMGS